MLFGMDAEGESWVGIEGGGGGGGCCGGESEIRRRLRGGGLISGDGIVLSRHAVKKDCIYSCSSGGRSIFTWMMRWLVRKNALCR